MGELRGIATDGAHGTPSARWRQTDASIARRLAAESAPVGAHHYTALCGDGYRAEGAASVAAGIGYTRSMP